MKYTIETLRSFRTTISLTVSGSQRLLLKVPDYMTDDKIREFIEKHEKWIQKNLLLYEERLKNAPSFTEEQIFSLKGKAARFARERVKYYAEKMGVRPTAVKITSDVTQWGSCSGKNSICFSYRIVLLPEKAADYIVVHELAHIRVKNHGPGFYAEVARYMPDYKERISLLRKSETELGL